MDPTDSRVVDIGERFPSREARSLVGKKNPPKFLASIGAHEFLTIEVLEHI